MSLDSLVPPRHGAMRSFPPRDSGVLVPLGNRRAAALGVCLYTASSPLTLAAQRAAYWVVRLGGARVLPGAATAFQLPGDPETWRQLLGQWRARWGPISDLAVYRRRQADRVGLTMLAVRGKEPVAVLKIREEATGLEREQRALEALARLRPRSFSAPRPLGSGGAGRWHWSAQEVVFTRPHRPALEAPRGLFDEVSEALGPLAPAAHGRVAAHGDLTPWNLRRDHRGGLWLFDWEDWDLAPRDADRAYFCACSRALGGPPMPSGLAPGAVAHHRPVVEARRARKAPGVTLPDRILAAFDEIHPP